MPTAASSPGSAGFPGRARCVVARLAGAVLVLVATAGGLARAGGDDADEAGRLRVAAATDWEAKRYAEATSKLRRAAEIYERAPDAHRDDLAATRRSLVWTLARAGAMTDAAVPFDALLASAKADPTLRAELFTAYGALYEVARDTGSVDAADAVLEPVRTRAVAAGAVELAAQVDHDLGSIAATRGALDVAVQRYTRAVSARRTAKAWPDLAFSLNGLAAVHLAQGKLDEALDPLLEAHRVVIGELAVQPQAAVAATVRTVLDRLTAAEATTSAQRAWVWDVAEATARNGLPAVHRPEVLLRAALRLEAAAGGAMERLAASRRLATLVLAPTPAPPELRADLLLHAATLATSSGGSTDALGWLASVDVGTGPAAPHLSARRAVAIALARARQQASTEAKDAIERARGELKALGDPGLRTASLDALASAADRAGFAAVARALRDELDAARRDAPTGEPGAGVQTGGDLGKFRALGIHDAVFELRANDGRLRLTDLVTGMALDLDPTWRPRALALHGLALRSFGAYVRLERFAYGEAVTAPAVDLGAVTLADLEPYVLVPGKGALRVLRNGALTYVP